MRPDVRKQSIVALGIVVGVLGLAAMNDGQQHAVAAPTSAGPFTTPTTAPRPPAATTAATLGTVAPTPTPTPAPGTTAAPRVSVPVEPGPGQARWSVRADESVYSIARKFAMTPAELVDANGWAEGIDRVLYPGDVILVKAPPTTSTTTSTTTTTTTAPPPPPPPPPPPVTAPPSVGGDGCDVAANAIRAAGGNDMEVAFAKRIAYRESRCQLGAHNYSDRTRDDSWGPWQINYYGNLRSGRTQLLGAPETNVSSWSRAAQNFLKLLRTSGSCHWEPPRYCAG